MKYTLSLTTLIVAGTVGGAAAAPAPAPTVDRMTTASGPALIVGDVLRLTPPLTEAVADLGAPGRDPVFGAGALAFGGRCPIGE